KIMEENHYYPFGLKHSTYADPKQKYELVDNMENTARPTYVLKTDYQYKYNGKELQDELNLNTYAYGWRDYDPATARFNKIDRFAEKYPNASPYHYAGNNPTRFTDVKGDSIWINFGKNNENRVLYQDGQLLNADGSAYTGDGVKIKKDGSTKITNSFLKQSVNSLNTLGGTATGGEMLSVLQDSGYNFNISNASFNPGNRKGKNEFVPDNENNARAFIRSTNGGEFTAFGSGGTIYWNPSDPAFGTLNVVGGTDFNPTTNLGHELGHGWDSNYGLLNGQRINGIEIEEIRGSYIENQIRGQLGAPLRSNYNGQSLLKGNSLIRNGSGNPTVDFIIRSYSIQVVTQ
ncbi:M91 family zinc metallopeptidase, partial [Moheibacter sediminis]